MVAWMIRLKAFVMAGTILAGGCTTGQVMAPPEGSTGSVSTAQAETVRYQWDLTDL